MNKIFIILFLNLTLCSVAFGETYFFKECKIAPNLDGNFLIDSEKRIIKRVFINLSTKATKEKIRLKIKFLEGCGENGLDGKFGVSITFSLDTCKF